MLLCSELGHFSLLLFVWLWVFVSHSYLLITIAHSSSLVSGNSTKRLCCCLDGETVAILPRRQKLRGVFEISDILTSCYTTFSEWKFGFRCRSSNLTPVLNELHVICLNAKFVFISFISITPVWNECRNEPKSLCQQSAPCSSQRAVYWTLVFCRLDNAPPSHMWKLNINPRKEVTQHKLCLVYC